MSAYTDLKDYILRLRHAYELMYEGIDTTQKCREITLRSEFKNQHEEWLISIICPHYINLKFSYYPINDNQAKYQYIIYIDFYENGDIKSSECYDCQDIRNMHRCEISEIKYYFYTDAFHNILSTVHTNLKGLNTMQTEQTRQFTDDTMDNKALNIVLKYAIDHLDKSDDLPKITPYLVWKSKILQNWKYLISTNLPDGMYYELTYNGDKKEWYLDAYKKFENKVIKDE